MCCSDVLGFVLAVSLYLLLRSAYYQIWSEPESITLCSRSGSFYYSLKVYCHTEGQEVMLVSLSVYVRESVNLFLCIIDWNELYVWDVFLLWCRLCVQAEPNPKIHRQQCLTRPWIHKQDPQSGWLISVWSWFSLTAENKHQPCWAERAVCYTVTLQYMQQSWLFLGYHYRLISRKYLPGSNSYCCELACWPLLISTKYKVQLTLMGIDR